jgi:hypothetical protein
MYRFMGKVVISKQSNVFSEKITGIITQADDNNIWVGAEGGMSFSEFEKTYKFINEEDQKIWDEFYAPLRAKELLRRPDNNNDDDQEEEVTKKYKKQWVQTKIKKDNNYEWNENEDVYEEKYDELKYKQILQQKYRNMLKQKQEEDQIELEKQQKCIKEGLEHLQELWGK